MRTGAVIEVMGPAGAGKSTITAALAAGGPDVVACSPPSPRERRNLPFFLRNLTVSSPTVIRLALPGRPGARADRRPRREEIGSAAFLQGWSTVIDRRRSEVRGAILLDQGPLYLLAELWGFGPPSVGRGTKWWSERCRHWAGVLDAVVYLDAADSILIPRIRTRARHHRAKHLSDRQAGAYLARWRRLLDVTLQDMLDTRVGSDRSPPLEVIRIDTGVSAPEEIAQVVLKKIGPRDAA